MATARKKAKSAQFSAAHFPGNLTEPRAFKEETSWLDETAPPVDGEANRELVRFLARACGAARADVQVVRGHRSRDKVVAIAKEGLTLEALLEELREHV